MLNRCKGTYYSTNLNLGLFVLLGSCSSLGLSYVRVLEPLSSEKGYFRTNTELEKNS